MSALEFLNLKTRRNQVKVLPRLQKGDVLADLPAPVIHGALRI
jgi:hypothetical protein